jgi:aryl-alcohol dehydrogenase-like predicted oxidoreductase
VNGPPFASGLLTDRGAPAWHPASADDQSRFRAAAEFCRRSGTSISRLALQFSSQNPEIPTTLFSSASPESVCRNLEWYEEPCDMGMVAEVRKILEPVLNKEWSY